MRGPQAEVKVQIAVPAEVKIDLQRSGLDESSTSVLKAVV
jgi:hypothetical protein